MTSPAERMADLPGGHGFTCKVWLMLYVPFDLPRCKYVPSSRCSFLNVITAAGDPEPYGHVAWM
jgi:hypothetical protein